MWRRCSVALLRSVIGMIEGYLCVVINAIAQQKREWGNYWFEKKHMRRDDKWDVYTLN